MKRLGLVVPRYGEHILGGAETLARTLAERLVGRGYAVTVLTTRARDHYTWQDVDPGGRTIENGVTVWRFGHRHRPSTPGCQDLMARLERLTVPEQYAFLDCLPQPVALFRHLMATAGDYDLILFIPYLYPSTYYGALVRPERSVIWPCLHDEPLASYHLTKVSLSSAHGLMFNTEPELILAERLGIRHPRAVVVGTGLDDFTADGERFRSTLRQPVPYVVYSGRLDASKNVPQLLEYFVRYKQAHPASNLALVLMGEGPIGLPQRPDIVPLGVRRGRDMQDVLAGALALFQPSLAESFSLVIMESWLAGRPVVVHADCAVTADHVARSDGGWAFRTYAGFAQAMSAIESAPSECERCGRNGRAYVVGNYSWSKVLDRFEAAYAGWVG